jgi:hypothetical protein
VYHIKLTDSRGQTFRNTKWGPGIRHAAERGTTTLCTHTAIHFYSGSTLREALALAVHMNPTHADFRNPRAWVFEPEGEVVTDGTKCGCKAGTTVTEVPLPKVTAEQRAEVAIRCVLEVHSDEGWVAWAEKWLSGEDRSQDAATLAAGRAAASTGCSTIRMVSPLAANRAANAAAEADVAARATIRVTAMVAESVAADAAARAADGAAYLTDIGIAKIAAEVYYREEEAGCTTSS